MIKGIVLVIMVLFLSYCFLPNYWARKFSSKVLRKGQTHEMLVALTFDDGPSPYYTPKLLDILKEFDVVATFFVLGEAALENPGIIKRIVAEGHDIGCHSYSHRHAWLMFPWTTQRDMEKSRNAIVKVLGRSPLRYRPPWGTYNAMTLIEGKRLGLKPTHWSLEAEDWAGDTTVEHIKNRIIDGIEPGSIIVLHDNRGAESAPERTLEALPTIIHTLKSMGYRFVSLDEMEKKREEV